MEAENLLRINNRKNSVDVKLIKKGSRHPQYILFFQYKSIGQQFVNFKIPFYAFLNALKSSEIFKNNVKLKRALAIASRVRKFRKRKRKRMVPQDVSAPA